MELSRKDLIGALASFLAAPAIVRASSLMPVKACVPTIESLLFRPGPLRFQPELKEMFEKSCERLRMVAAAEAAHARAGRGKI